MLCKLYGVSEENYTSDLKGIDGREGFTREIDFYLIKDGSNYKCEHSTRQKIKDLCKV